MGFEVFRYNMYILVQAYIDLFMHTTTGKTVYTLYC
jgi:hypothetical protein